MLVYFSPHLSIHRLKQAIDRLDVAAYSQYVDSQAIVDNFRADVQQRIGTPHDTEDPVPRSATGSTFFWKTINKLTASLVTPGGMRLLLHGVTTMPHDLLQVPNGNLNHPGLKMSVETSVQYHDWNTASVSIRQDIIGSPMVVLNLLRTGWFSWKVVRVQI